MKLTPLSKAVLAIVAIAFFLCAGIGVLSATGGMAMLGGGSGTDAVGSSSSGGGGGGGGGLLGGNKPSGELGSKGNPLKVSIVSFHGYAPALVANGASLTTQPGSLFEQNNVHVQFLIQDNVPTLAEIYESDTAHCAWRTSDFWAQEQPNLRGAGLDGKAVMIVDNTQGADAIISTDPSVNRVEDLVGKQLALLEFTPSHGMVIDAVQNSSLSARKKKQILDNLVFINVDEGTAGVRAALESGAAQAAALWDPDLSLALTVAGAHVIYSTKTATNLIYDVMVCDTRVLDKPGNRDVFQGFVAGWMQGVDAAEKNPDAAVEALVKTEEFFALLEKDQGRPFIKKLFDNLVWTGLEDNIRILGMSGGTNQYERVYRRFDGIYRAAGALANPNAPVINPSESIEYVFIRTLMADNQAAQTAAKKPQFEFSESGRQEAVERAPTFEKPVIVSFKTGSAELNERSKRTINDEMVPLVENHGSAYFSVSGNTDSTGSRGTNVSLSKKRAATVVAYLVDEWEFDASRFEAVGNGPDKPLCDEKDPDSYEPGTSIEDCREVNRTVRVAVQSR